MQATVLIQAAATVCESEYLLGIADATPGVAGVVGWVNFESSTDRRTLERLAGHPKFVGVRPMIKDIPDDNWMLRDDVQWGYRAVEELNLAFDVLGCPRHLGNLLTVLNRYPKMRTVIDHCMNPQIRDHSDENFNFWAEGMRRIADETGAHCKLSGLVSGASERWSVEDLKPYAGHVLDVFGCDRIMWGSDWPVCRLRAEYSGWFEAADHLTGGLSASERAQIFGGNAARFYRLDL